MDASQLQRLCADNFAAAGIDFLSDGDGFRVPAACREVGDLLVYFDNGEVTVDIEHITHCHFTPYEASETYDAHTVDDCVREATDSVRGILKNEWVLWRYPNGAGGCYQLGTEHEASSDAPLVGESVEEFFWSGRIAKA